MEYVNYSLILLAILVALLIWLLLASRFRLPGDPMSSADASRQRQLKKKKQKQQNHVAKPQSPEQITAELKRNLAKVPTPWGWPNYEKSTFEGGQPTPVNGHANSISKSFHHWADRLVQGKHTVDDEEYRRRKERWLRTLLEDRYGRSAVVAPSASAKQPEVPAVPHDPVDTFSGHRVDKVEARFLRKGQTGEISYHTRPLKLEKQSGLKDLKMPWGW